MIYFHCHMYGKKFVTLHVFSLTNFSINIHFSNIIVLFDLWFYGDLRISDLSLSPDVLIRGISVIWKAWKRRANAQSRRSAWAHWCWWAAAPLLQMWVRRLSGCRQIGGKKLDWLCDDGTHTEMTAGVNYYDRFDVTQNTHLFLSSFIITFPKDILVSISCDWQAYMFIGKLVVWLVYISKYNNPLL